MISESIQDILRLSAEGCFLHLDCLSRTDSKKEYLRRGCLTIFLQSRKRPRISSGGPYNAPAVTVALVFSEKLDSLPSQLNSSTRSYALFIRKSAGSLTEG